ncbi:MAG: hypothetical protein PHX43_07370 [Alphaproteobacteria bacterium]|nr:hypothetical protein [Alphaproteobacteria bacterium]
MARKKQKSISKNPSPTLKAAFTAVKNMKNLKEEPLPGRTLSDSFKKALVAVKNLGFTEKTKK